MCTSELHLEIAQEFNACLLREAKLQRALQRWMPQMPGSNTEVFNQWNEDAMLLAGMPEHVKSISYGEQIYGQLCDALKRIDMARHWLDRADVGLGSIDDVRDALDADQ